MHAEYPLAWGINTQATRERAEKLAARCTKKGLIGGWTVTVERRITTNMNGTKEATDWLIIDGEAPALEGWKFVAVAEWLGDNPVVTGSPWYEGAEVEGATLRKGECDHCGTSTYRKRVIIVEDADGKRLQVGTACVKDFLGHNITPSWYSTKDPFDEFGSLAGGGEPLFNVVDVFAVTLAVVKAYGFHPAHADRPTRNKVDILLTWEPGSKVHREMVSELLDESRWDGTYEGLVAAQADAAAQVKEWGQMLEGESGWAQNARAVATTEYIPARMFGLAASIAGVWARQRAEVAEQGPVVEERYADDKARLTLRNARLVREHAIEGAYGTTHVYNFVADQHRFTWFASNPIGGFTAEGEQWSAVEGSEYDITGTVKGVSEYRGEVATRITRCKVVRAGRPVSEHGFRR